MKYWPFTVDVEAHTAVKFTRLKSHLYPINSKCLNTHLESKDTSDMKSKWQNNSRLLGLNKQTVFLKKKLSGSMERFNRTISETKPVEEPNGGRYSRW